MKHFLSCLLAFVQGAFNFNAILRFPLSVLMGTVPGVTGSPDYTYSGTDQRIPWAFSRYVIETYYNTALVTNVCNTAADGDIKDKGDIVTFNTIPEIISSDYEVGMDISWQDATSPAVTMKVNRALYWAFKLDKVNKKQIQNKAFMEQCATNAAKREKEKVDTKFLASVYVDADPLNTGATAGAASASYNMGATGAPVVLTKTNILDQIEYAAGVAKEANWPKGDWWMALPTWASVMLNVSDLKDASMTGGKSTLDNDRLGEFAGFKLFETNLYTGITDGSYTCTPIMFGHKDAICYASQLTDTEYFDKLENTFGAGMKGLHVFDWKVIKKQALGVLYARKGQL